MRKIKLKQEKIFRNEEYAKRFEKDSDDKPDKKTLKKISTLTSDHKWWKTMVEKESPQNTFDMNFNKKAYGIREKKKKEERSEVLY